MDNVTRTCAPRAVGTTPRRSCWPTSLGASHANLNLTPLSEEDPPDVDAQRSDEQ